MVSCKFSLKPIQWIIELDGKIETGNPWTPHKIDPPMILMENFPKKPIQCNLWSQITDVSNVFFYRYLHSCKIWKPKFLETRNQDCLDLFGMETKLTFNIMVGDFAIA